MQKLIIGVILIIFGLVIYALFAALPAMLLWNWIMPELFGLKTISFMQSIGLCFLCGILFRLISSRK